MAKAGLLLSSALYAVALTTPTGRRWAARQTWSTVVAGVALTTGWMATESRHAAGLGALYFAVAGVPIIFRSLWLQLREDAELLAAIQERGEE